MNDSNLTQVMDALDLNALLAEEQEALLLDLNSLIFRGSMVRLIERMDEGSREEFAKLMESDADDASPWDDGARTVLSIETEAN